MYDEIEIAITKHLHKFTNVKIQCQHTIDAKTTSIATAPRPEQYISAQSETNVNKAMEVSSYVCPPNADLPHHKSQSNHQELELGNDLMPVLSVEQAQTVLSFMNSDLTPNAKYKGN